MKVSVDRALCEANGVCVGVLPEVFDLDEEDELQVRNGELVGDEVARAEQAVLQCPKGALRVSR